MVLKMLKAVSVVVLFDHPSYPSKSLGHSGFFGGGGFFQGSPHLRTKIIWGTPGYQIRVFCSRFSTQIFSKYSFNSDWRWNRPLWTNSRPRRRGRRGSEGAEQHGPGWGLGPYHGVAHTTHVFSTIKNPQFMSNLWTFEINYEQLPALGTRMKDVTESTEENRGGIFPAIISKQLPCLSHL